MHRGLELEAGLDLGLVLGSGLESAFGAGPELGLRCRCGLGMDSCSGGGCRGSSSAVMGPSRPRCPRLKLGLGFGLEPGPGLWLRLQLRLRIRIRLQLL